MLNFYHFLNHECCVFVYFCSLDLNAKNSVIQFFYLSVQISESIIPTRPDNRESTEIIGLKFLPIEPVALLITVNNNTLGLKKLNS